MRKLTLLLVIVLAGALAAQDSGSVTFNRDILPILQKNCQSCHRSWEKMMFPFFGVVIDKDADPSKILVRGFLAPGA